MKQWKNLLIAVASFQIQVWLFHCLYIFTPDYRKLQLINSLPSNVLTPKIISPNSTLSLLKFVTFLIYMNSSVKDK